MNRIKPEESDQACMENLADISAPQVPQNDQ